MKLHLFLILSLLQKQCQAKAGTISRIEKIQAKWKQIVITSEGRLHPNVPHL